MTKKISKKKYKSLIKKRNNFPEEDKKDNFKTEKTNKLNLTKYFTREKEKENNNNNSISNLFRHKKMISTPFLYNNKAFEINNEEKNNNTIDNDDIILNYKLNKIQEEINSIKEKNESLLKNLSKEQERNTQLKSSSKDIEKI